jgi:hypothetical protein
VKHSFSKLDRYQHFESAVPRLAIVDRVVLVAERASTVP